MIRAGIYLVFLFLTAWTHAQEKPNILLITVDDMNWNSVGAYGNTIDQITPNIDHLAKGGVRFENAYVTASNCSPSRVSIQTGLFPHQSGARGFYYIDDSQIPTIATNLKAAGYFTGVINKGADTDPSPDFKKYWDQRLGFAKGDKYDSKVYREQSTKFYKRVKGSNKPFYLVVNIADPHKPFYNDPTAVKRGFDQTAPSRIIDASEVEIPSFLPNLPAVRNDLRNYYNSVKRADDCVGAIMESLLASGNLDNTLVIFLSDHGMPFPFAKSSVYENGLRTPLIMSWPGQIESGTLAKDQIVSSIDIYPTFLDAAGLSMPTGNNYTGTSLLEIVDGSTTEERMAFGNFDENASGYPSPMRGVISEKWNYVFNAWGSGNQTFKSAAMYHASFKAMAKSKDPEIRQRVAMLKHRVVEELYDLENDPGCTKNLINQPQYSEVAEKLRQAMKNHMIATDDYLLEAFNVKNNMEKLDQFMEQQKQLSMERAQSINWKRPSNMAGSSKENTGLYLQKRP